MSREDYQMEFNGLVFGLGTEVGIESITGFDDFSMSMGDSGMPRGWGDVPGLHVASAREVTIELTSASDEALWAAMDAFQPTPAAIPLYLKLPTFGDRMVYARAIGRVVPRNPVAKFKKMATVRLKLADPRVYSAEEYGEAVPIYDPSGGGEEYPVEFPIEFVGAGSGQKIITNAGNANAYPAVRFYGPTTGTVTGVVLTNVTTGKTLEIGTTILTDQILAAYMRRLVTVDPGDEPYISLDGSTRYGDWALPREPFYLAPGDNLLRFTLTGTSTDAICVINHRDTWL